MGSELIGQPFAGTDYFWGRPSATGPLPYNAAASSGSNLGPLNPALLDRMQADVERIQEAHPGKGPVPVDLVTASGAGSIRTSARRPLSTRSSAWLPPASSTLAAVRRLVDEHVEGRTFGILGEPRVNVLKLNLALDRSSDAR